MKKNYLKPSLEELSIIVDDIILISDVKRDNGIYPFDDDNVDIII